MMMYEPGIKAWYGDQTVAVDFPDHWEVIAHRPRTPRALTDDDVVEALRHPCGQLPIRELAKGRNRPVIVVDDCTRPTPAARVLPHILDELQHAGIPADHIEIVVATGTHGPPGDSALHQKIGEVALRRCTVHVHDDQRDLVHLGRDSRGSPVLVNRHVAAADYVIGVGGVYSQNSTGFGGGAKLVLGVLGRRSTINLHDGNPSEQGSYNVDSDLRRGLDEIAKLVRLETSVCLHVDVHREVVRITTGDHRAFYRDVVAFSAGSYRAGLPLDADVVVANAYPMDLSLTFLRSKAIMPLLRAGPGASRILIAGCPGRRGAARTVPVPGSQAGRSTQARVPASSRASTPGTQDGGRQGGAATPVHVLSDHVPPPTCPNLDGVFGWAAWYGGQAHLARHAQRRVARAVQSDLPDHAVLGGDRRPDSPGAGRASAAGHPLSMLPLHVLGERRPDCGTATHP